MFTGEKLEVSHLGIFGCPIYVHVLKDKRTKLDPPGNKDIYFGYNETSKEYEIYIPCYKKFETIIDVTLDEYVAFKI